eukprot:CAMPEP_0202891366 /NCGR_PEP_ID=MMETSP1392-20130828/1442_1 /ASSEMBLY_ACC=CAM_ASM_000868 /TAXON_ID=225041 /ORGANISM="Chlamydomonas chlamydogama, Strain SAG 11-48b" /LENGTH=109 /DNA_ID=CAMNT_0049575095 /DNA_START=98 /DNA_END=424 /DNA_ORIENTATION=-
MAAARPLHANTMAAARQMHAPSLAPLSYAAAMLLLALLTVTLRAPLPRAASPALPPPCNRLVVRAKVTEPFMTSRKLRGTSWGLMICRRTRAHSCTYVLAVTCWQEGVW